MSILDTMREAVTKAAPGVISAGATSLVNRYTAPKPVATAPRPVAITPTPTPAAVAPVEEKPKMAGWIMPAAAALAVLVIGLMLWLFMRKKG